MTLKEETKMYDEIMAVLATSMVDISDVTMEELRHIENLYNSNTWTPGHEDMITWLLSARIACKERQEKRINVSSELFTESKIKFVY